jgi:hypothetical protein
LSATASAAVSASARGELVVALTPAGSIGALALSTVTDLLPFDVNILSATAHENETREGAVRRGRRENEVGWEQERCDAARPCANLVHEVISFISDLLFSGFR